jgi:hypothetical protein
LSYVENDMCVKCVYTSLEMYNLENSIILQVWGGLKMMSKFSYFKMNMHQPMGSRELGHLGRVRCTPYFKGNARHISPKANVQVTQNML